MAYILGYAEPYDYGIEMNVNLGIFISRQAAEYERDRLLDDEAGFREKYHTTTTILADNFFFEEFKISDALDDWEFNYNQILEENRVEVYYNDKFEGERIPEFAGWSLSWAYGCMFIGSGISEGAARQAAALFVSLWLRGVTASFGDKLMIGYLSQLKDE